MGKLTTATKFKLIKTLLTTIFVIIIVCFLMVLFQAVIGDVLWKLISGYYMSDLPFLTSLIQVFIPAILIFFFWQALFHPSVTGSLLTRRLGFDFLMFPEDFFYKEKNILETRKCRYLIFYRGPYVVRILGNDFINLDSIFSDHLLSVGKTDIFLYKTLWFVLFAIMIVGSLFLFNATIDPPIFGLGARLVYKMCLIFFIIMISGYLSYMTWRKYILDHSHSNPGLIFRGKFLSLHLPNAASCIFICPFDRFGEFNQKRAESLCESFLKFRSENINNSRAINIEQLKKWADENVL